MVDDKQVKTVMTIIDKMLHDTSKPWTNFFGKMETRTGVSRFKILIGLLLATSVTLFVFGAKAMVLSNAIGLIYPAQATVSLVFSPPRWKNYASAAAAAEAKNKKFTYWLIFSAVLIVEQVCGFVLFLFPWYMPFRTVFLMWCSAPIRNNGAGYIFKNVIYKNLEVNKKLVTYKFKLLLPKIIMVFLLFELC
ncbi:receptor expression-enhancing protein 5-like [Aphis craccivora]|uniref:Receptor expression-enhancing protein n=1 Tax=Aphis craccivora TaxID=307492 RepID=A0A6G0ZPJ7_APHCR|nr:receptor expression-enhancing protein 5-like [Aphis craccivora]